MASVEQKPKITLHWLEKSRAQRIVWLLEELGLEYELKTYKRNATTRLSPPELSNVHPLGTSPILTVEVPGAKPIVMVESAQVIEYLTDYYGKQLIPNRYPEDKDGQVGTETEEWVRYRHFMHYAEGSIMPLLIIALIVNGIEGAPVPFFIKPITRSVAGRLRSSFLSQKLKDHLGFIQDQIKTAPEGGPYLCGNKLTAADFLMVFPLGAAQARGGVTKETYPEIVEYYDRLTEVESYKRAVQKVEAATGEKFVVVG